MSDWDQHKEDLLHTAMILSDMGFHDESSAVSQAIIRINEQQTAIQAADKEIATKDAELARLREALDMPDGYVLLPVKPTRELIEIMAAKRWPDIWEKGRELQRELGCGIVPPNAECEEAAGTYMQLIEALKSHDS